METTTEHWHTLNSQQRLIIRLALVTLPAALIVILVATVMLILVCLFAPEIPSSKALGSEPDSAAVLSQIHQTTQMTRDDLSAIRGQLTATQTALNLSLAQATATQADLGRIPATLEKLTTEAEKIPEKLNELSTAISELKHRWESQQAPTAKDNSNAEPEANCEAARQQAPTD